MSIVNKKAYESRRKWRKTLNKTKAASKDLREEFLKERAEYQSEINGTMSLNELKQIKHHENQRQEARRIKTALKGRHFSMLNSLGIPDEDQYPLHQRNEEHLTTMMLTRFEIGSNLTGRD